MDNGKNIINEYKIKFVNFLYKNLEQYENLLDRKLNSTILVGIIGCAIISCSFFVNSQNISLLKSNLQERKNTENEISQKLLENGEVVIEIKGEKYVINIEKLQSLKF